ncbi:hypothetical protein ACKFKG_26935 [Phormidesmis sp. 146-35]
MVDTHTNHAEIASLHSIVLASLQQLLDRQITTPQLVQLAEQYYWELLEGQLRSDRSPNARHLKEILSDIVAQWESRSPDSPEEFPTEWIDHWLTQLQSIPMTHIPNNQPPFHITHQNGNINTGDITIQGDMIGTQHHTTENLDLLVNDFQAFILSLQQKYAAVTDETAIAQIIDVEAKLIESQDKLRWQNFLNLKRLWNGGKKAALKVGEHFVETNPWGKGAIAFLEGVSEDVK